MHHFLEGKKGQFEKAIEHLKAELAQLRTGRANTSLVENLDVELYGSAQPLKNLASITVPDATTVQIDPWDANAVQAVEKAIQESDIGINPTVAGKIIRLSIPPMTEDTRKELVKVVGKKVEEARISLRNVREEVKKEIGRMGSEDGLPKDEEFQMMEELDELVASYNGQAAEIGKEKEAQVTKI